MGFDRSKHKQALDAGLSGDFATAHQLYGEELDRLAGQQPGDNRQLYLADILRDDGFTYTRQAANEAAAIRATGATDYSRALQHLATAHRRLHQSLVANSGVGAVGIPGEECPEVNANRGATTGLIARTATLSTVIYSDAGMRNEAGLLRDWAAHKYAGAHALHRAGDNGYYRVRNALATARHERLLAHAQQWRGG